MRYLIQSVETGKYLCPSLIDGSPEWVSRLISAGGGVILDYEEAVRMAAEYSEIGEKCDIVDLDRLGTRNDYEIDCSDCF